MTKLLKCSACGAALPPEDFSEADNARGRGYYCRACDATKQKQRRKGEPGAGRRVDMPILPPIGDVAAWTRLAKKVYRPKQIPPNARWRAVLHADLTTKTLATGTYKKCQNALDGYRLPAGSAHYVSLELCEEVKPTKEKSRGKAALGAA